MYTQWGGGLSTILIFFLRRFFKNLISSKQSGLAPNQYCPSYMIDYQVPGTSDGRYRILHIELFDSSSHSNYSIVPKLFKTFIHSTVSIRIFIHSVHIFKISGKHNVLILSIIFFFFFNVITINNEILHFL